MNYYSMMYRDIENSLPEGVSNDICTFMTEIFCTYK